MTSEDEAILKIAYLLTALDGTVTEDEKKMFRIFVDACHFNAEKDEDDASDVLDYMERFSEDIYPIGTKICNLKGFLSDEELVSYFMKQTQYDLWSIRNSPEQGKSLKRALALWFTICMSDSSFTAVERPLRLT